MEVQIKDSTVQIDKIFHLADIQVRPLTRHEEFNGVFEELYKKLHQHKATENSAIVICGDILQEKDKLKPEIIMVLRQFFKNLLQICPIVIVIAGNHDLIENNNSRMDNLTPILDNIGVHYLKESGAYRFGNVIFGVTSLIDKIHVPRSSIPTLDNVTYVALYHGMLAGSYMNDDIIVTTDSFRDSKKLSDFADYDYVMLGDIHTHQYLKPNIAYSGSLVQQNFGETLENHGMIKWNLVKKTSKFIEVPNQYGFVNIIVRKGKLYREVPLPAKPYIRYHAVLTTDEQLREFRETYEKDLDCQRIETRFITQAINEVPVELTKQADDTNLLKQELKDLSEEDTNFITDYHQKIKAQLIEEDDIQVQSWKILKLEFRNVMIYGNNVLNVIDFSKLGNVISIYGRNAIGKSCIQKMLLFALFDRFTVSQSSGDKNSILNKDSKECFIAVEILHGNKKYRIEKKGRARMHYGKREMKFTSQFFRIGNDGEEISLNGEHRIKTNGSIFDILGITFADFLLTNLYSNTTHYSILNITETERLDTLNKYFRLDWYKQLLSHVKSDIKAVEENLAFSKGKLETTVTSIESFDVETLKKEIEELEKQINSMISEEEKLASSESKLIRDGRKMHRDIINLSKKITVDTTSITKSGIKMPDKYVVIDKDINELREELDELRLGIIPGIVSSAEIETSIADLLAKIDELEEPSMSSEEVSEHITQVAWKINEEEGLLKLCGNFEPIENAVLSDLEQIRKSLESRVQYTVFIKEKKQIPVDEYNDLDNLIQKNKQLRTRLSQILTSAPLSQDMIHIKPGVRDELLEIINNDISEQKVRHNQISMDIQYNEEINKDIRLNEEIKDKKRQLNRINGTMIMIKLNELNAERDRLLEYKTYYNYSKSIQELYKQKDLALCNEQNAKKIDEVKKDIKWVEEAIVANNLLDNKILIQEVQEKQKELTKMQKSQDSINKQLKNVTDKLHSLKAKHNALLEKYAQWGNNKNAKETLSKEIIQNEKLLERYKIYIRVVDRNGLPLRLINTKIGDLTQEINNFLCDFVGFQISIDADTTGKRPKLNIYVTKNNIKLNTQDLSGYETFVLNLGFKFALNRHNFIGKCNMLCIDEGLDCIDETNFAKLGDLFNKLRTQYSQIMVISHIENLRNFDTSRIGIQNNGKYSRIA